jgi:hypothetical protein
MRNRKRAILLYLAAFVLLIGAVCLGPSLTPVRAAATHLRTIDTSAGGGGARVLLGDVTGNGRLDIVMMQPDYMSNDAYYPHEVQALTAYDALGNRIWQIGTPDSRVTKNGTDIPAQIYDIDNDGYNEVLACMNGRFRVFDGATGVEEYSFAYPSTYAHDAIVIADFAGDGHPSEIVLKDRYDHVWALNTPSGSVRWTYSGNTGHYPWPYDFDGDGRDELMCGYDLLDDNGQRLWTATGLSDHADSMWVADFNQDGYPDIVLGGSDTGAYERNGHRLWLYTGSTESQQVVVGDLRPDIAGLETAGLDRIDRSSNGLDGLFILSNTGQQIWKESRSDRGCYSTIIDMVEEWDGTDRLVAFNRGCQKPYVYIYNGSGSIISTINVSGGRVMHADVCGDYHDEMFIYLLGDRVEIYSNGGSCDLTQTTGSPLPQIKRLYNYTRYTAGETPIGGGPSPTNTPVPGPTSTPTRTPTPGPTSTPGAGGGTYQAEDAVLGGDVSVDSDHSGYNGTGFVNFPSNNGYVEYQNVDGGSGGSATLRFRFALGASSARTGQLSVNGSSQDITFDSTGAWDTWTTMEVEVTLNSGTNNTIRLSSTGEDLANQDQLEVIVSGVSPTNTPVPPTNTPISPTDTPVPPTDTPISPTDTPIPPTDTPGPTSTPTRTPTPVPTSTPGGGGGTYQAEDAILGGDVSVDSNHAGYNGTGFVNFPSNNGYVEYQNVDGGSGGGATLRFRFALGATSARTGQLTVNGSSQNITFDPTGAWDTWTTMEVEVTLNSGTNNTIRLSSTGQDLANQDQLEVID